MGTQYRKAITKYAMYITLIQIAQMVGGMFVTIRAVMYQTAGEECHVDWTNSMLGLTMYASYFVLFLKLFFDNLKKRSVRETVRQMSRKITQNVLDQTDGSRDGEAWAE